MIKETETERQRLARFLELQRIFGKAKGAIRFAKDRADEKTDGEKKEENEKNCRTSCVRNRERGHADILHLQLE